MNRYEQMFGTIDNAADFLLDVCDWQSNCRQCLLHRMFGLLDCEGDCRFIDNGGVAFLREEVE